MQITLEKRFFTEKENTFFESGDLTASLFLYKTGIHGVRLSNNELSIIVLPFMGQQIWDAACHGRRLTMKSLFPEPKKATFFLDTYGCFLMHCGALRMGNPGPQDNHPTHGELPCAAYDEAALVAGQDEKGNYIGITGLNEYNQAFTSKYHARPSIELHEHSTLMDVSMVIENLSNYPMELMYMCHVNFVPVDHGRIVQNVEWTSEGMKLWKNIPTNIDVPQKDIDFLDKIKKNPKLTEVIDPDDQYNLHTIFSLNSTKTDEKGWTHFMQMHPDGSADYLAYKPEEFDHNVRWMIRTKDHQALAFALPATCDAEGYTAEKQKGNIKHIPANEKISFSVVTGYLNNKESQNMENKITEAI